MTWSQSAIYYGRDPILIEKLSRKIHDKFVNSAIDTIIKYSHIKTES